MKSIVCLVLALVAVALAFPQKEGGAYTNEALRQAQQSELIPKGSVIQDVKEGIELGAYLNIPVDQKISLKDILGDHVPPEVLLNLQEQIDKVGHD